MSSVNRAPSQIAPREKYLLAIATTALRAPAAGASISAVMTADAFADATTSQGNGAANTLYRDLGKEVVTLNGAQQQVALYRLCQRVNGSDTEGVPTSGPNFYIRVWAADPASNPVTVARIG